MKGKEALDCLTMITSNKEKKGLCFQGESSQIPKKNNSKTPIIKFVRASNQKSWSKQSLLYSQKACQVKNLKKSFKTVSLQPQKLKRFESNLLKSNSR